MTAEVPVEMYEEIKCSFAERLEAIGDEDAVIDAHRASEFLNG